jgi:hypothetical protein
MKVFLWSADFLFFLRKIFGNKMFLAWSKQLENEGMGTRIGVSSFFISQSLSSMTMYIIFFFHTIVFTLQKVNSILIFVMVLHFFLYLPASMDTRPWLNIYILNSNKSKQNVITYCIFIDQWKKIPVFLLIFSKRGR